VYQNFAELLIEEEAGRLANKQMTRYFDTLDAVISTLMYNNAQWVFDQLPMEELAEIPAKQLEEDYERYCKRHALKLDWLGGDDEED
jgi:hypothetical protein